MNKRYSLLLIILFFLPLLVIGGTNYLVDPLQLYGKSDPENRWLWENQRFQNAGKFRSYLSSGNFQSVLIGNSVADCFVPNEVERKLGWGNLLKLTIDGGSISEQLEMVKQAIATGKIKHVLWATRAQNFMSPKREQWNKNRPFPHYLYTPALFDDGAYLFSTSMFFNSLRILKGKAPSKHWYQTSLDDLNYWMTEARAREYATYSSSKSYKKTKRSAERFKVVDDLYHDSYHFPVIDHRIVQLIRKNKDVEFVILITPDHYLALKANYILFPKFLAVQRYLVASLAPFSNVRIYGFSDDSNVGGNLANYRDEVHYNSGVNAYMLRRISKDRNRLTTDNIDDYLAVVLDHVRNYEPLFDYENAMPMYRKKERVAIRRALRKLN